MSVRTARPRFAWGVLVLLAAALVASSCSKKKIVVDPVDGLEGVGSNSQLLVWPETPLEVDTYRDTCLIIFGTTCEGLGEFGPEDIYEATETVTNTAPGTVHGLIFDYTNAESFEVFRATSGGFAPMFDHPVAPARRYFQSQSDLFRFDDPRGVAAHPRYIGRGIVAGVTTRLSPKTNISEAHVAVVAGDLQFTGINGIDPPLPAPDSLLNITWNPYPGAAGYWVHLYQLTDQNETEIVLSGLPAPMFFSGTRDNLLAFFPGTVTGHKIGDPLPVGARVIKQSLDTQGRPALQNNQVYFLRIAAVDATGQVIAYNGDTGSRLVRRRETGGVIRYLVSNLGATLVNTKRPAPPPSLVSGGAVQIGATSWVVPARDSRAR